MSLLSSILEIAYGRKRARYFVCFLDWVPFYFYASKRCYLLWFYPDWKAIAQNTAAHICYLVAEANFEQYSESARLCLLGADHWKFPRTYASPEAIQVVYFISPVFLLHFLICFSSPTVAWFAYTYDWHVLIILLIVLWSLQKFCFHSSSVVGQKYVAVCFWRI